MIQQFEGVEIKALSACIPKRIVSNDSFSNILSPKELRVFEKTIGIHERRWSDEGMTASDLAYIAAQDLIKSNNVRIDEINSLIFISQTPDYKIPFTSNILQKKLGLNKEILCLDINAGCAGFIQGLSTAFAISKSFVGGKVLLIMAETMSKLLSSKDRSTTMLFGDGAAALLIENTGNLESKAFINIFSDGAHADAIIIPDGGYRNPVTELSFNIKEDAEGNLKNALNLNMDGAKVFDFTLREIAPSIELLLHETGFNKDNIDYFLLHQSNEFIIKQIAAKLNLPMEKILLNISKYGNTSGVSIPLLMASYGEKFKERKNIMLSGYGVGLNWGNCILKNIAIDKIQIIEYDVN